MENFNDIVKLAIDAYHGNTMKYSVAESNDVLREALIDMNGGSTKLDYKSMRRHPEMFDLIETILANTVVEGFQDDAFFMNLVDFRNVALGDKNEFIVENDELFTVAEIAEGTQGVRRQRLAGASKISIPTTLKAVKIYDELNRIMAGQVDFNKMINAVGRSFRQQLLNDVYDLWSNATATDLGGADYCVAGQYDEDALLDLIAHVEAAAGGKTATIVGTKKAIRALAPSIVADGYKDDLYNMGYAGKFYGSDVVALPQYHQINSTNFVLPDDSVTVIAGDQKPVKVVYEGQSTIITGDPLMHGDLTQDYLYADRYGAGIILAGGNAGIGRYDFT